MLAWRLGRGEPGADVRGGCLVLPAANGSEIGRAVRNLEQRLDVGDEVAGAVHHDHRKAALPRERRDPVRVEPVLGEPRSERALGIARGHRPRGENGSLPLRSRVEKHRLVAGRNEIRQDLRPLDHGRHVGQPGKIVERVAHHPPRRLLELGSLHLGRRLEPLLVGRLARLPPAGVVRVPEAVDREPAQAVSRGERSRGCRFARARSAADPDRATRHPGTRRARACPGRRARRSPRRA